MAEKVVDIHKCPELTIEEIEKRWPDQWVLIAVTRLEDHQVTAGRVVGYGSDQEVDDLVHRELALYEQQPEVETYLFWTGEPIPEDMVVVL